MGKICRICDSSDLKFKFKIKNSELSQCKTCGFVQVNNEPSVEELNKIYGFTYFNHSKYQDTNALLLENQRRLSLVDKYVAKNAKLIDMGCAGGEFLNIAKNVFDVSGMDFSPQAIDKAKKKNPDLTSKLFVGDSKNFKTEFEFDIITYWDVIEHVWSPLEVINNSKNLLKKDGYMFLSTPNIGARFAKFSGKYWPFMTPPEHLSFLTKKSFKKLAEKTGFEIVNWETKGKRANVVFLFYKIGRIFPKLVGPKLINFLSKTFLKKISIYVPTGDVQYIVLKKK